MLQLDSGLVRTCATLALLFLGAPLLAQSEVDIEKFTNGQDADTAPGPGVLVGSTVNWTYAISNVGSRPLTNISVTDNQGVTVTCPDTALDAGLSFTCTASGTAVAGQYANIGTVTATLPDASVVQDSDPSHYFGQAAFAVALEKRTNGFDADTPPGPTIAPGSTVNWEYEITNIGNEDLTNIAVADDQGVTVTCPGTTLAVGASMICTGSGIAVGGPYANIGTVTATLSVSLTGVSASDPSHYFGRGLIVNKRTNGVDSATPPGPTLNPGDTVTWTYEVTNPGPETVTGLTVTDDQGVTVTCPQTTLVDDETVTCTASGIVQPGQYTNLGTATANLPLGGTVTGFDTSYYFGSELGIRKLTNGSDADVPTGPSIAVGATVNWTYIITNYSAGPLTAVTVTDDQSVTVTCPLTTLAAGESMTCTASGVAVAGQYANIGTVEAQDAGLQTLSSSNPSHYFGQTATLDFGDASDPSYSTLFTSDGARHLVSGALFLGACVDAESDAFASANADGDDADTGTPFGTCATPGDDEDGVTFTTALYPGETASVDIVASAPCTLSAWIDFAGNGDWSDSGDELFPGGTALVAGTNSRTFTVPATAVAGPTYSRFRCTTSGAVGVTGEASDGEVEDHAVTITALPEISATKTDALLTDDGDGLPEPGETLRYTIVITNNGGDASSVAFNDTPDANTALVAGSVTTSTGTVTTGNGGGDTSVSVNIGTLAGSGGSVTITFDVVIDDPLPPGVTTISNQGAVSGTPFSDVPTDDPAAGGTTDPTVTSLTLTPDVSATKTAVLFTDANNNGQADPGDRLRYTITVTNSGSGDALAVVFDDTPDANTNLVAGSVTTTAGTVTTGNTAGDTTVSVSIGTLAANGGTATIIFDVTIDNPLAPGVTQVVNSGTIRGSNIPTESTDDPGQAGSADPTPFPVVLQAIAAIPTLGTWALLALLATLSVVALRRITS